MKANLNGVTARVQRSLSDEQRIRLRQGRINMGMSQLQLAVKLGVDVGTVSRIERGLHYPSRQTEWRIAQVLNIQFGQPRADGYALELAAG